MSEVRTDNNLPVIHFFRVGDVVHYHGSLIDSHGFYRVAECQDHGGYRLVALVAPGQEPYYLANASGASLTLA